VYNAQSCAECHQNPVTGSASQIAELRAGHRDGAGNFVAAPGGSLINDRATKIRTAPLWGTRTRDRHMHDGLSLTFTESILRHGGEATGVINNFRALSTTERNQIVTFLQSL